MAGPFDPLIAVHYHERDPGTDWGKDPFVRGKSAQHD